MRTLFDGTPTVAVRDGRGAAVRSVSYNRASTADAAEALITRQEFDAAVNASSSIDPRLFASRQADAAVRPNLRQIVGLSKQVLRTESVDAGMRASLADVRGMPVWTEDGKRQSRYWEYDALGRVASVHEYGKGSGEQCRERFFYGERRADAASRNLRGRLTRRYDTAGLREIGGYGLSGEPLRDEVRFLTMLNEPDWPASEADGEVLLEAEVYRNAWRYGTSGEVLEHVDAAGHARRWGVDVAGQLKTSLLRAQGAAKAMAVQSKLSYAADGVMLSSRDGNGVRRQYEYEAATRRLRRMAAKRESDGAMLQDLRYAYDPVGNVTSIEDASRPAQYFRNQKIDPVSRYAYDALYQLIEAQGQESAAGGQQRDAQWPGLVPLEDASRLVNYTRRYEYDAGGNLLSYVHRGATEFKLEMSVSAMSNRAVKKGKVNEKTDVESGFDGNGNLKQLEVGQALEWDARNQLIRTVQIEHEDGTADDEIYVYDGDGQRARKIRRWKTGSQWQVEEVRYLAGLELRERRQANRDGSDLKLTERWQVATHGDARLLRWTERLPEGMKNDSWRYGMDDHLGSMTAELDETGQLASREEYYPYGGTAAWAGRSEIEADYKTVRYSGKERDKAGLYYYGYRYYAPWLARWLNPDPAGVADGLNVYRMVRNDPMTLADFDGLAPGILQKLGIRRREPSRLVTEFVDVYRRPDDPEIPRLRQRTSEERTADNETLMRVNSAFRDDTPTLADYNEGGDVIYQIINQHLRGLELPPGTSAEEAQSLVREMREDVDTLSAYEGAAYRVMTVRQGLYGDVLKEGKIVVDQGYMSASALPVNAIDWLDTWVSGASEVPANESQENVALIFGEDVSKKIAGAGMLHDHILIVPNTSLRIESIHRIEESESRRGVTLVELEPNTELDRNVYDIWSGRIVYPKIGGRFDALKRMLTFR